MINVNAYQCSENGKSGISFKNGIKTLSEPGLDGLLDFTDFKRFKAENFKKHGYDRDEIWAIHPWPENNERSIGGTSENSGFAFGRMGSKRVDSKMGSIHEIISRR